MLVLFCFVCLFDWILLVFFVLGWVGVLFLELGCIGCVVVLFFVLGLDEFCGFRFLFFVLGCVGLLGCVGFLFFVGCCVGFLFFGLLLVLFWFFGLGCDGFLFLGLEFVCLLVLGGCWFLGDCFFLELDCGLFELGLFCLLFLGVGVFFLFCFLGVGVWFVCGFCLFLFDLFVILLF